MRDKLKFWKIALPALIMSAFTFEILPGSVAYYTTETIQTPETAWNFFTVPAQGMVQSCLMLAAFVTFAAMILALVALCFKKPVYQFTGWCSLGAGALAAVPYMTASAEAFAQPNVVILLVLMACWLIAMYLYKKQDQAETSATVSNRL